MFLGYSHNLFVCTSVNVLLFLKTSYLLQCFHQLHSLIFRYTHNLFFCTNINVLLFSRTSYLLQCLNQLHSLIILMFFKNILSSSTGVPLHPWSTRCAGLASRLPVPTLPLVEQLPAAGHRHHPIQFPSPSRAKPLLHGPNGGRLLQLTVRLPCACSFVSYSQFCHPSDQCPMSVPSHLDRWRQLGWRAPYRESRELVFTDCSEPMTSLKTTKALALEVEYLSNDRGVQEHS